MLCKVCKQRKNMSHFAVCSGIFQPLERRKNCGWGTGSGTTRKLPTLTTTTTQAITAKWSFNFSLKSDFGASSQESTTSALSSPITPRRGEEDFRKLFFHYVGGEQRKVSFRWPHNVLFKFPMIFPVIEDGLER